MYHNQENNVNPDNEWSCPVKIAEQRPPFSGIISFGFSAYRHGGTYGLNPATAHRSNLAGLIVETELDFIVNGCIRRFSDFRIFGKYERTGLAKDAGGLPAE
jgi:hypothetical protein